MEEVMGPMGIAAIINGTLTISSVHSYGDPARVRAVVEHNGQAGIAYLTMDAEGKIARIAIFSGEL